MPMSSLGSVFFFPTSDLRILSPTIVSSPLLSWDSPGSAGLLSGHPRCFGSLLSGHRDALGALD